MTSRGHRALVVITERRMSNLTPHNLPLAALAVLLCWSSSAQSDDVPALASVSAVIEKRIPGATIVTRDDINQKSCGSLPKTPGLVTGDFNGDGRTDFAALLKVRSTGKLVHWEGKTLEETEFAFAIFLDDGHGGFEAAYVRRFKDLLPILSYIDVTLPGNVKGIGEKPGLVLKNSAVSFVNCEKSEAVYYVSGAHVQIHWVSD